MPYYAVPRRFVSLLLLLLTAPCFCAAQEAMPEKTPSNPIADAIQKNPGLLPAVGELVEKLQHEVTFPADRTQSCLIPLLPPSTNVYVALPNYGIVAHQALATFRKGLKENQALHEWWTHGEMLKLGPKIEDAVDKFSQVSEYLGDEIVISASAEEKDPHLLILAEVRKPGLRQLLPQTMQQLDTRHKPSIHIVDAQELAAIDHVAKDELVILARPDFIVATTDLAGLREFNGNLDHPAAQFPSTAFGQRILQSYQIGISTIGAADLEAFMERMPKPGAAGQLLLQRFGFDDLKYFVWEHHDIAGHTLSQSELSFTGPRRGIAGWLAPPVTLGSLEFVSPKAMMVISFALNDPAAVFDHIRELAGASDPKSMASLAQMEQGLGISFKDDLFGQLAGEITIEADSITPPAPSGRLILRVKDATRFQQTLNALLFAAHLRAEPFDVNGVALNVIRIPRPKGSAEVAFTFVNDYLILGSNPDAVIDAVGLHNSGESLAKSNKFHAALPPGHPDGLSAMIYQDPVAMATLQMQRLAPNLTGSLAAQAGQGDPAVVAIYGNDTSIQEASTNGAFDAGAALVVAAIAIPNLLRSRIAANEASAVGNLRTINTAQVTYATTYPDHGFATDLASLGSEPNHRANSEQYAGLLHESLANPGCPGGKWCEKSGYRFTTKAVCAFGECKDYVAIATPMSPQTGSRSFCSTSDGVIRYRLGPPLAAPLTLRECRAWQPLQ